MLNEHTIGSLTFCRWFNHLTPPPPQPPLLLHPTFPIFIHHLFSIPSLLCAISFSSHSLSAHSLSYFFSIHILRLRGSFINSTTPYSSKNQGMGGGVYCGRVAPSDLLTAARWGLPDNLQQPRRVLKGRKGVWRIEWSEEGGRGC